MKIRKDIQSKFFILQEYQNNRRGRWTNWQNGTDRSVVSVRWATVRRWIKSTCHNALFSNMLCQQSSEVGIYNRKQKSKKTRTRPRKRWRKQEKREKTRSRTRKWWRLTTIWSFNPKITYKDNWILWIPELRLDLAPTVDCRHFPAFLKSKFWKYEKNFRLLNTKKILKALKFCLFDSISLSLHLNWILTCST